MGLWERVTGLFVRQDGAAPVGAPRRAVAKPLDAQTEEAILSLASRGYTPGMIVEELAESGLTVSERTVQRKLQAARILVAPQNGISPLTQALKDAKEVKQELDELRGGGEPRYVPHPDEDDDDDPVEAAFRRSEARIIKRWADDGKLDNIMERRLQQRLGLDQAAETQDPIDRIIESADRLEALKNRFGGNGAADLPAWAMIARTVMEPFAPAINAFVQAQIAAAGQPAPQTNGYAPYAQVAAPEPERMFAAAGSVVPPDAASAAAAAAGPSGAAHLMGFGPSDLLDLFGRADAHQSGEIAAAAFLRVGAALSEDERLVATDQMNLFCDVSEGTLRMVLAGLSADPAWSGAIATFWSRPQEWRDTFRYALGMALSAQPEDSDDEEEP